MFDTYSRMAGAVTDHVRATVPKEKGDSDFVWRQATRAKALDAVRGALPAASLSNVGIYGSGQAFENLLLRMRAHPLPEARHYADMMLMELRKVIPSFLRRVDLEERGVAWSGYLESTAAGTQSLADRFFGDAIATEVPEVSLVDFDPDGENKIVAAALYSRSHLPESQILAAVEKMSTAEKTEVLTAYVGDRSNRRHRPGRAFERTDYRFDILSDYGAFRDLQRHRLLTIEWQPLTPYHGYTKPELVVEAGVGAEFDDVMGRSHALFRDSRARLPGPGTVRGVHGLQAALRDAVQREGSDAHAGTAFQPAGHPAYRRVALEMHRLIAEKAGHRSVAAAMNHMTTEAPELERLASERQAERRRTDGQR